MVDVNVVGVVCAVFLWYAFVLLMYKPGFIGRYYARKHKRENKTPTRIPTEYVFQYKQRWFGGLRSRDGRSGGNMVELRPSSAIEGLITQIIHRTYEESMVLTSEGNMYVCDFSNPKDMGGELYVVDIQVVGSLTEIMGICVDYVDYANDETVLLTDISGLKWMYTTSNYVIDKLRIADIPVSEIGCGILHKLSIRKALLPCDILDYGEYLLGVTGEGKLFWLLSLGCLIDRDPIPEELGLGQLYTSILMPLEINRYFDRKRTQITQRPRMNLVRCDDSCAYLFGNHSRNREAKHCKVMISGFSQDYESIVGCYNVSRGVYLLDQCGRWFYASSPFVDWKDTVEFFEITRYRGMKFLGESSSDLFEFALVDETNGRILIEHKSTLVPICNVAGFTEHIQHRPGSDLSVMKTLLIDCTISTGRSTKNARTSKSRE